MDTRWLCPATCVHFTPWGKHVLQSSLYSPRVTLSYLVSTANSRHAKYSTGHQGCWWKTQPLSSRNSSPSDEKRVTLENEKDCERDGSTEDGQSCSSLTVSDLNHHRMVSNQEPAPRDSVINAEGKKELYFRIELLFIHIPVHLFILTLVSDRRRSGLSFQSPPLKVLKSDLLNGGAAEQKGSSL